MKIAWNSTDYSENSSAQATWAFELLDGLGLRGDENVLDIGCGDGKVTAALADRVPLGTVVGVDSSDAMIQLARDRHWDGRSNLRFAFGDASRLSYAGNFDVVFSNSALHWIVDHRPVIRGIRNALRPGGRAALRMGGKGAAAEVVETFNRMACEPEWEAYFRDFRFQYGFYAPDEYRVWLAEAGLRPERIELVPRVMEHARAGFAGWIRTTWMGYTQRVPETKRDTFIETLIDRYLAERGGSADCIRVTMTRLDVVATKP